MQIQILDARYIIMGIPIRFLEEEFGKDNFELESEV